MSGKSKTKFSRFAKRYWLQISGFAISLSLALFFAFTFMADAIYFNDPRHKDEDLKNWMTPRYIVLSYDVPRNVVLEALGIDQDADGKRLRMRDIADRQNTDLAGLTNRVRNATERYREAQQ